MSRRVVLQNLLLNPKGRANTFVEIDLVQEHLNFFKQKIYKADGNAMRGTGLPWYPPCIDILRKHPRPWKRHWKVDDEPGWTPSVRHHSRTGSGSHGWTSARRHLNWTRSVGTQKPHEPPLDEIPDFLFPQRTQQHRPLIYRYGASPKESKNREFWLGWSRDGGLAASWWNLQPCRA